MILKLLQHIKIDKNNKNILLNNCVIKIFYISLFDWRLFMLKFGLIGCGRIGSMHADILHHEDDVILESVFDINTNLAKGVSKKTGAKICNHDFEVIATH